MSRRRRGTRAAGLVLGAVLVSGLFLPHPQASRERDERPPPAPDTVAHRTPTPATAPSPATAAKAAPPPAPPTENVEARPGDTPLKLLARVGVDPDDAQEAARLLARVWDPRDLRPGQRAAVLTQADRLLSFRLALAPDRDIVIARDHTGGFVVEDQDRPTHEVPTLGSGTIRTSVAAAADRAGVPPGVLAEMIRAFSYDVDFEREIHPGDTFTVLYDRVVDEVGRPTRLNQMTYAEMVLDGHPTRLFRFKPADGEPGYFTADGENTRKPLLRTPIDGARLSSGFGMRLHPILGYTRMHQGIDFAAPSGTEIYAAGDGTLVQVGRVNGYGNYVEVRHNGQYTTAYAHLSRFARALKEGERVRQGEVIGYVGMTGNATGPHLHYEIHDHGAAVDPQGIKMPAMTRLAGADLKAFEAQRAIVENRLIELRQDLVAHAACSGTRC